MAFIREGTSAFTSLFNSNPGGTLTANQSTTGTPFPLDALETCSETDCRRHRRKRTPVRYHYR